MRRLSIAFAVAGLIAAACGQPPSGSASPAPSAAVSAAASPTRGGTAIIAIWQEPTTLLPLYRNQTVATVVGNAVVEGLAKARADGQYEGELAKTAPTLGNGVTVSGSRMEVRWELKPDLKWSDGAPLTSADISSRGSAGWRIQGEHTSRLQPHRGDRHARRAYRDREVQGDYPPTWQFCRTSAEAPYEKEPDLARRTQPQARRHGP